MYGAGEDGKWHPILFFTLDVEKIGDRQSTSLLEPEFHEMASGKNSDNLSEFFPLAVNGIQLKVGCH